MTGWHTQGVPDPVQAAAQVRVQKKDTNLGHQPCGLLNQICLGLRYRKRSTCKLDDEGREMGVQGLKACIELAIELGKEDPPGVAVEYLKEAIDRMAVDKWHSGENPSRTKYLDWEHLFRGQKKPCPRKLTEYWLNDDRTV